MPSLWTCALVVAAAMAVPAFGAGGGWRVLVHDDLVQPGDVLHVEVAAPEGLTALTATWNERQVPFRHDADGRWRALLGVDVATAAGPAVMRLAGAQALGAAPTHDHTIQVAPKAVRTRRLRVSPRFVNPPRRELPRIRRETALLNALFRETSAERLWGADAVRPVEGVAVSGFGVRSILNGEPRGPHNGLDLAAVTGTPVHAPTAGLVAYARAFYYSGNTVILDHGQGLYSTMAHLSAIDVAEGERVAAGALLGKVGATGRVTGPHLHWAVRLHGARVDPLSLLDALATSRRPTP